MSGEPLSPELAKKKLHELNAKIQADPCHKLEHIKVFYSEQVNSDIALADVALIIHSIAAAGEEGKEMNQTDHAKAVTPIFIFGMCLSAAIALSAIVLGGYAIYKNSQASTEVHIWATSISTGSVGAAIVFIGVVGLILVIRTAFRQVAYSPTKS